MSSSFEALGMSLMGSSQMASPDPEKADSAAASAKVLVAAIEKDLKPRDIITRKSLENAYTFVLALGGSTNAVLHLLAVAGRIGVTFEIDDWDKLGRDVPCLVDLMPSGRFLMEDFYYAGGLPVVMKELLDRGLLHGDVPTVSGRTVAENVADAACWNREVIHAYDAPFKPQGGIVVLRGNLAPGGAVLKPSAATPALMQHRGRAVVFDDIEHFKKRVDDPALDIDESCVMVLKNCGPKGYPGMAEVGNMPLPQKLLTKGVRDMVRISDARMSGTAYGTVVLHTTPEAAVGGPLALVADGDMIELDVDGRRLHLAVDEAELARRRARWTPPKPAMEGGYQSLYVERVLQADRGADLDFLVGCRGAAVPRESH
jgi:dihydroxyacid dehydratase/phosphogluconate dehydratase